MISKGIATFTLDTGQCPRWLFERMVSLAREMVRAIVIEFGPDEFVKRMSDPVWFQSLGTVLAFDWNASGLTTILTAALKEAIRQEERELGIFICGGKGKTSLKAPEQIQQWSVRIVMDYNLSSSLVYNSKMAAKVDSALVQDGYNLYHHCFIFSKNGAWTVVQQGMNTQNATARRYHWHSDTAKDLVCEPHSGISSQKLSQTLDLAARNSEKTRALSTEMVNNNFYSLMRDVQILRKYSSRLSDMVSFKSGQQQLTLLNLSDENFTTHPVVNENFWKNKYLQKVLYKLCERKPENYEKIASLKGVGPKTLRALALVAEVIYGAKPSYEDPARYSFAHGGKDCIPYPVDKSAYDNSISFFQRIVPVMRISPLDKEKLSAKIKKMYAQK